MSAPSWQRPPQRPPSALARSGAWLRLCGQFYLGLHAPARRARYAECRVRAAAGRQPSFVRDLFAAYRDRSDVGTVTEVNFRCWVLRPQPRGDAFFLKRFPRKHVLHDLERRLRCSRVDRAWRAGHLLPLRGLLTPKPVGTVVTVEAGETVEYLITARVPDALPFHERLRAASDPQVRTRMLEEFARHLRHCHDQGIYLRDLVTNMLTQESPEGRRYWLTDLDQFHPLRRLTRGRLFHQLRQLARWTAPLTEGEIAAILASYLGVSSGRLAEALAETLRSTPQAPDAGGD